MIANTAKKKNLKKNPWYLPPPPQTPLPEVHQTNEIPAILFCPTFAVFTARSLLPRHNTRERERARERATQTEEKIARQTQEEIERQRHRWRSRNAAAATARRSGGYGGGCEDGNNGWRLSSFAAWIQPWLSQALLR